MRWCAQTGERVLKLVVAVVDLHAARGGICAAAKTLRYMALLLGQAVATETYRRSYDASLLFPIPREGKRREIGIAGALPFAGARPRCAHNFCWCSE